MIDRAREDFCRFLSACYYEPSADFAAENLFDSMRAAAGVIDPELAEHARRLGAAFAEHDLQTLLIDHTALFIGPSQPKATPYASFWLAGDTSQRHELMQAATDFYAQGGFEVSEDLPELPDHVAVELEFLYALIFAQNQARQGDNADELATANQLQRKFLVEHCAKWVGLFATAVMSTAETTFYRELAELTERFVQHEVNRAIR